MLCVSNNIGFHEYSVPEGELIFLCVPGESPAREDNKGGPVARGQAILRIIP